MPENLFSPDALQKYVDTELTRDIPQHHVQASVRYRVDGRLMLDVVGKINGTWQVKGNLAWNLKSGKIDEGSLEIAASW